MANGRIVVGVGKRFVYATGIRPQARRHQDLVYAHKNGVAIERTAGTATGGGISVGQSGGSDGVVGI